MITLIGTSTVGVSALANLEKLTCGLVLMLLVEVDERKKEKRESRMT